MSCRTGGRLRNPRTHRCVTCRAFKDSELKQFTSLLGQKTTGTRKELCNRVRRLVNPDKFDVLHESLSKRRSRSRNARRRSLERLHGGVDAAKRRRAPRKKKATLFDFIDNGFVSPTMSMESTETSPAPPTAFSFTAAAAPPAPSSVFSFAAAPTAPSPPAASSFSSSRFGDNLVDVSLESADDDDDDEYETYSYEDDQDEVQYDPDFMTKAQVRDILRRRAARYLAEKV